MSAARLDRRLRRRAAMYRAIVARLTSHGELAPACFILKYLLREFAGLAAPGQPKKCASDAQIKDISR